MFLSCVLFLNHIQCAHHFRYFLMFRLHSTFLFTVASHCSSLYPKLHLFTLRCMRCSWMIIWCGLVVVGPALLPLSCWAHPPELGHLLPFTYLLPFTHLYPSLPIELVWHLQGAACSHICVSSFLPAAKVSSLPKTASEIAAVCPSSFMPLHVEGQLCCSSSWEKNLSVLIPEKYVRKMCLIRLWPSVGRKECKDVLWLLRNWKSCFTPAELPLASLHPCPCSGAWAIGRTITS